MSDKTQLTEEELQLALATFSASTGRTKCPICQNETWEIETEIGRGLLSPILPLPAIIGFRPTNNTHLSPVIPCFVIVCEECGFVRHHSIPMLLKKAKAKR